MKASVPFMIIVIFLAIAFGTVTGFGISKAMAPKATTSQESTSTETVDTEKAAGIPDKSTFKDTTEGTLREGGIEGEGSFHLERPGGKSQTVYLTSSTVDLSEYIGKKVKVWGETHSSEKAGWLMDVGYVEVQ